MSKSLKDSDHSLAPPREDVLLTLFYRSRAFLLLAVLILKILLSSLSDPDGIFAAVMRGVTVIAAIAMAADTRRHLTIGLCLGVPALVMLGVGQGSETSAVDWVTYFFSLLLYVYIIRLMLMKIFHSPVVTLDTIGLALCCYVLLGQIWILFYLPVIEIDPNAFSVPLDPASESFLQTVAYFSYVTLTTLGYGDISPVSPIARALATIEALTGTLFLAVLISRLIGTYGRTAVGKGGGKG